MPNKIISLFVASVVLVLFGCGDGDKATHYDGEIFTIKADSSTVIITTDPFTNNHYTIEIPKKSVAANTVIRIKFLDIASASNTYSAKNTISAFEILSDDFVLNKDINVEINTSDTINVASGLIRLKKDDSTFYIQDGKCQFGSTYKTKIKASNESFSNNTGIYAYVNLGMCTDLRFSKI